MNSSLRHPIITALFSLLLVLLALDSNLSAETLIFVSPSGHDNNPGTQSQPLASPAGAKRFVRRLIDKGLKEDVLVTFAAGTYELANPLVFEIRDSGSSEYSIRYRAAEGETVIWSGGRRIVGWNQNARGHWEAKLANPRDKRWFFRLLTIDDERATRARWPNHDGALRVQTVNPSVQRFTFNQALPNVQLGGQNTELVAYGNWSISRSKVAHSDSQAVETETAMGWIGHGPMTTVSPGKPVYFENHESFLDLPNEWSLNPQNGKLTFIPREDQNIEKFEAIAPTLSQLLRIEGSATQPIKNLIFQAIQFQHCDFPLPEIGYNEIQASHYGTEIRAPTFVQPVAIECVYAVACRFDNCRFAHINNSAVGLGAGCQENQISYCTFEDIGGSGVLIGWRGQAELDNASPANLSADWKDPLETPRANQISDCIFRRCGQDAQGAVAIFTAFSNSTKISHNQISDLPYTGISVGFRWDDSSTSQAHCIVENNHIFDVVKKLADGGGIYTLGRQPGTTIRGNYIHDVKRSKFAHGGAPNNGIFIDQGSTEFEFESNVIHSTSGEPIRFNLAKSVDHKWRNNFLGDQAAQNAAAKKISDAAGPRPQKLPR